jgi:hypothetical protein
MRSIEVAKARHVAGHVRAGGAVEQRPGQCASVKSLIESPWPPIASGIVAGGKDGTARMWSLRDLNIAK